MIVVIVTQTMKTIRKVNATLFGSLLFSLEIKSAIIVMAAHKATKGKLYAGPQLSRWGFMYPNHAQTSTPIHGRFKINGSDPNTMRKRIASLKGMV